MLAGPLKTHGQSLGGFSVLGRVRLTKEKEEDFGGGEGG